MILPFTTYASGGSTPQWVGSGSYSDNAKMISLAIGGNQPHDHDLIPPYYALCYIMKQ